MAQTKKDLLIEAEKAGIVLPDKATISQIKELLAKLHTVKSDSDVVSPSQVEEPAITTEILTTAKAGKRSAKSIAEAAEKELKEQRKLQAPDEPVKPKIIVPPTRSRLERRGKHYKKSVESLTSGKLYTLSEAVELAKKTSHVKFDATVELHINLGVDPRHADQNIRDIVVLPAGSGKTIRVAVLTDDVAAAKASGADIAGLDDLMAILDKGAIDFDILITTPAHMSKLGKYARTLGPRGLMPNPKSGTVTNDINKAIAEAKAGRVEYRVDSTGIVHLGVGKISFSEQQLSENILAVIASIKSNKPQSVKGTYLKSIFVASTMGPSIAVDTANIG